MKFSVGDPVVHWTYGLGKIVALQERALGGQNTLYYAVQIRDLTVWVPVDEKATSRLRAPTTQRGFKKLFRILREPGKALSEDRLERKTELHRKLQDGNAETICAVIRDLISFQRKKGLNDDDKQILRRASSTLLDEWGYSFSVTVAQAEQDLLQLLRQPPESLVN